MGIRTRQTATVATVATATRRTWPGKRPLTVGASGVAVPAPGKRTRAQALRRPRLRPTNDD